MSSWRYMDAVKEALAAEMHADEKVFLAGIDIAEGGGIMAVTRGLLDEFGPERVLDTPISETGIMGMAVGAAMAGYRPVVEIMFMDFLAVGLDPLINQAAKLPYMTGGGASVPMVVRTQTGAGRSGGAQHSQSLEGLLAHIPGLRVVMPSTPTDAASLLRGAIRSPDPVVFVENRRLYGMKEDRPKQMPEPGRLGKARRRREGTDVTVVTWSRMVHRSSAAAEELAQMGISVEIIDLRTIVPYDTEAILESVSKTGRLLVVHEAVERFGPGAEIVALSATEAFDAMHCAPARLGGKPSPIPFSPPLENAWLPAQRDIVEAAISLTRVS